VDLLITNLQTRIESLMAEYEEDQTPEGPLEVFGEALIDALLTQEVSDLKRE